MRSARAFRYAPCAAVGPLYLALSVALPSVAGAPEPQPATRTQIDSAAPAHRQDTSHGHHRRAILGTNLADVNDWATQLPFADLFKLSRAWLTQCNLYAAPADPGCTGQWNTEEAHLLDLDEHGWVRSLPAPSDSPIFTRATTFWALNPRFPGGRYVVFYDGAGTLEFGGGASRVAADSAPGREVIRITPSSGITLTITATDPEDYLRNIRILAEATAIAEESGTPAPLFNPAFVQRTTPYQVLRFMEWAKTNDTPPSAWEERPKPNDARWTDKGVPLEVMLALAAATESDPWFTVPHAADDVFVQRMAELALRNSTDSRIYVEHSNEVWNSIFAQSQAALTAAKAAWPQAKSDDFTRKMNWHGRRTAEICQIWKAVFAEQAHRVHCVLGAQAANPFTAEQALDCPLWDRGPCAKYGIDSIAIAPYFGAYIASPAAADQVSAWTRHPDGGLEALFTELSRGGTLANSPADGPLAKVADWTRTYRTLADKLGLNLFAYEGGQHIADIFGNLDPAAEELFAAANRDPRMGDVYEQYLTLWRQTVGDHLFVHFTDIYPAGKHGAWGALEHVGQSSSPKYDALMRYLDETTAQ